MKKVFFAGLLVLLVSSISLAQSDSLPATTNEQPCLPANCNSPRKSGPCAASCCPAAVAEPFVPKWVVGVIYNKLEKENFNGTIFIDRKKNWFSYGLGLKYEYKTHGFMGRYSYYTDSFYTERTGNYSNGALTLLPGISISESYKPWQASAGLQLVLTYGLINDYEKATTVGPYETYIYEDDKRTNKYAISMQMPFTIERLICIRNKQFTIGLTYILAHGGVEWGRTNDENTWVEASWTDSYSHTNKYTQWLWDLDLFNEPSIQIKYIF
jgi:hypothetical protein